MLPDTKRIAEALAKAAKDMKMPVVDVRPMAFVDDGYFVFCEGKQAHPVQTEGMRTAATTPMGKPIVEIVFKVYPSGTKAEIKRGLEIGAQKLEREIMLRACESSGIAATPTGRQGYNFLLASDPDYFAPMAAAEQQKQQGMTGQAMPAQAGPAWPTKA
jgi:hypothetical protein